MISGSIMKLCLEECPVESSLSINDLICIYDEEKTVVNAMPPDQKCWPPYATKTVLHFCIPSITTDIIESISDNLNTRDFLSKVVSDVYTSWKVVLVALAGAVVLGIVWLIMMRFCATFFVWFSVWSVLFLLVGTTVMLYMDGTRLRDEFMSQPISERVNSDEVLYKALLYTSYVLMAITSIIFLVILCSCSRIQLGAIVCREASKAMGSMIIQLLLWPLIPFIFIVCLAVYFVAVLMYAITTERPAYEDTIFKEYQPDLVLKGLMIYHLLGLLWTFNFIVGVSEVTICGAIADWYWSFSGKNLRAFPVIRSFGRTLRYHLGSIALGSLILGIIQLLRIIVLYFVKKLKGRENRIIRGILKFVFLILSCIQSCIEFINKNAYVMISVYGYSFCGGAKRGFEIIASNPLRVGTVKCVNALNVFLGKVFICVTTTIVAYIYLKNMDGLYFFFFPAGFIAIFSWFIGCIFMSIYDMAVHTILYCFIEDEARNDGSEEKPYAMSKSFKALLSEKSFGCCCC